jgi:NH3-dependent NAD+ synthetase
LQRPFFLQKHFSKTITMEKEINPLIRTEVIELNIGANVTTSYNFGQLPNLRTAKRIIRVEAYDRTQVSKTLSNKDVITNAVLLKSYLKLVELGGTQATIHTLPLYDISQQQNAMVVENINCQPIDWEKSTINIPETTGLSANESFIIKVKYIK